jgi:hypothetical protein
VREERNWKLVRCCSFVVMVVEIFLCYVVATVGTSKLNIIVQLCTLRDKSRVLGM